MDYSRAQQLVLALSDVAFGLYHVARERPRAFWSVWALAFAGVGLLLLSRAIAPRRGVDSR